MSLNTGDRVQKVLQVISCGQYESPSGLFIYNQDGVYIDEVDEGLGCITEYTIYFDRRDEVFVTLQQPIISCGKYIGPSGKEFTTSGIQKDTLEGGSYYGCDSIITFDLDLLPNYSTSVDTSACDEITLRNSDSTSTGDSTYTFSGVYQTLLESEYGCDNTIFYTVTIFDSFDEDDNVEACNTFTSNDGTVYNTIGEHIFTEFYVSVDGCDSTVNKTVEILDYDYETAPIDTVCDQFITPYNNYMHSVTGFYSDTLIGGAENGCAKVFYYPIRIIGSTTNTISVTQCDSYTVPSEDETYTESGVYLDTVVNSVGCDSILTINLTILESVEFAFDTDACYSYTVPSGDETYSNIGTLTVNDTIPTSEGCDSVLVITVTIRDTTRAAIDTITCATYVGGSGTVYNETGIYLDTNSNEFGCAKIDTINLTIIGNSFDTITPIVCETFTSVNGNSYTETGVYNDTFPELNQGGCDSIQVIDLTVNKILYDTIVASACDTYTSPSGNYTYNSTGTYEDTIYAANATVCDEFYTIHLTITSTIYDTLTVDACYTFTIGSTTYDTPGSYVVNDTVPAGAGCDSVYTYFLTINDRTFSTTAVTSCDFYVLPSGQDTVFTSGTYEDTIVNVAGCDSVMTILVDIKLSSSNSITVETCDSYTVPSGSASYNTSGVYVDTLTNAVGCDSLLTINLTINKSTFETISVVACDSYTVPSTDETYTIEGSYVVSDTLVNNIGCDSIITINLTLKKSSTGSITADVCDFYVLPNQNDTVFNSGIYRDTLTNAAGCDSVITVNVTIRKKSNFILNVQACDTYTVPSGDETYTAEGSYVVKDTLINQEGCDSILTINLSLNYHTRDTLNLFECGSYTVPSKKQTITAAGDYVLFDTIPNVSEVVIVYWSSILL